MRRRIFGLGCSLFLIALVLIQRGRGGGLAGAFGGAGGQSAFGTKAGDVFEIEAPGFGLPLRNPLAIAPPEDRAVAVQPL